MATAEEIAFVRRNVGSTGYTDEQLGEYVDNHGGTFAAVAVIWEEKAATYADMVNTKEGVGSLDLSDLRKNAEAQATYWYGRLSLAGTGGNVVIRDIVREPGP